MERSQAVVKLPAARLGRRDLLARLAAVAALPDEDVATHRRFPWAGDTYLTDV